MFYTYGRLDKYSFEHPKAGEPQTVGIWRPLGAPARFYKGATLTPFGKPTSATRIDKQALWAQSV